MFTQYEYEKWEKKYKKFQKSNKQSITKMVLDFNRKKSANIAKKIRKRETGIINERILHTYKWNEKIFKTRKMVPEGKNHGIIMLVDCSGSMQDSSKFESAVKQAMILVEFCRKADIKYKVLGFANSKLEGGAEYENGKGTKHLQLKHIPVLREWFSHEQNLQENDFMSTYMLFKTKKYTLGPKYDGPNSGTPLIDSIFLLRQIALKFKKENNISILNTITLTDGLSNSSNFYEVPVLDSNTGTYNRYGYIKKLSSYDPLTKSIYRTNDTDNLENVLKFYKKVVGGNIIGFNISNRWYYNQEESIRILENYEGYDHHYTFSFSNIFERSKKYSKKNDETPSSVEELQENFKNLNISRNNEKILLSKFIDIIS